MKSKFLIFTFLLFSACLQILQAQENDTISNWDGITANWITWPGSIQVVDNPQPGVLNPSALSIKVTTSTDPYDLMLLDLPYIVSFDQYPKYHMLCYPPAEGGDVVLKFENNDVSSWQEIRVSASGGQWNLLEFDFTGLPYNNFTRMVIFFDFLGTTAGKEWYFDDITRQSAGPLMLQSNLPIVVINTFGTEIPDDPKITAHMGIISNGEGNLNTLGDPFNNYDGNIGIEVRGQSTQMFPKKCYGFETRDNQGENLNVSLLGLPEENDWILYAPYTDKSLMRNAISYEIGHRLGEYCTRNVYCELIINNDFKGIYILQEKIKKDENRVDIPSLNPDEITGDDVTGGYILAVDKLPWDFEYGADGWISAPSPSYPNAMDITFQYYYPEPEAIVSQQREYIKNYVTNAEKALIGPSFKDPSSGYLKYFDAPSFIDFMLLSEISKEVDKYRYSTYFNKHKDSDGGKLFAGPAWDFNLGYGNVDYWQPGVEYAGWLYELVNPWDASIMFWWKRMMEDSYFRNLAKTRWTALRLDKLSNENIDALIDSITELTDSARIRNFERWPILGTYVWPNYNWQGNDYEDEVAYFRTYLMNRINWMDHNIEGQVLHPAADIIAEANKITFTLRGDYFRHPIIKKGNFTLNDAPANIIIEEVLYLSPTTCTLTLSDNVTPFPEISVTVDKKIINTWEDLTSNKLATASAPEAFNRQSIEVFVSGGTIHLRCFEPGFLPPSASLYSITGQKIREYDLQNITENLLPGPALPGIYILRLDNKHQSFSYKIIVH
ncbi:MAG: CotH kinase family protein [Bacteroidales bacterium]|nr:CotH kinase family protein [Bacteroidales bacterium]